MAGQYDEKAHLKAVLYAFLFLISMWSGWSVADDILHGVK